MLFTLFEAVVAAAGVAADDALKSTIVKTFGVERKRGCYHLIKELQVRSPLKLPYGHIIRHLLTWLRRPATGLVAETNPEMIQTSRVDTADVKACLELMKLADAPCIGPDGLRCR